MRNQIRPTLASRAPISAIILTVALLAVGCGTSIGQGGARAAVTTGTATDTSISAVTTTTQPASFLDLFNRPDAPLSGPSVHVGTLEDATKALPFRVVAPSSLGVPTTVKFDTSSAPGAGDEVQWAQSPVGQVVVTEDKSQSFTSDQDLIDFAQQHEQKDAEHPTSASTLTLPSGHLAMLLDGDGPRVAIFIIDGYEFSVFRPAGTTDADLEKAADVFVTDAVAAAL